MEKTILRIAAFRAFSHSLHPTRQFPPAALNAGFAPHCRRSDACGLTSQIDPKATFDVQH